jgi:transposase-like protein
MQERSTGSKREAVRRLRAAGKSYTEISKELGLTRSTVAYHARNSGKAADEKAARRYDWAEVQAAYDTGLSVRQCVARFGFSHATWHEAVKRGAIRTRGKEVLPLEELLVVGRSTQTNRKYLRGRLVSAGLKKDECERCGTSEWMGRPLPPQLHHINGDGMDNRIENIQLLCPNCHAQTDNWGGRNKGRRPRAA